MNNTMKQMNKMLKRLEVIEDEIQECIEQCKTMITNYNKDYQVCSRCEINGFADNSSMNKNGGYNDLYS